MESKKWFIRLTLLCIFIVLPSCISTETITLNQAIKDGDVLVSSRKIFALGFFSPGNSGKRYVGVWYNQVPNKTIVWVANRDNPVNDTSGFLAIQGNGGLVIYGNERNIPLWSANVSLSSPNSSIVKLLDTGNLVLLENGDSQRVVWQGFDYPTDTMLPTMKLGVDRRSGLNRSLTSWKSQSDPGKGNCSYWVDPGGLQMILYKDGAPRWRSEIGSWTGQRWGVVTTFVYNEDEVTVVTIPTTNQSTFSRTVLDESGILGRFMWDDRLHQWTDYWSAPIERCDFYGQCGPNGNCDPYTVDTTLITIGCSCLPGYEPKSPEDWYMRDGSGGCVNETGISMCRSGEGFVKVKNVKLPDSSLASVDMSLSLKECEKKCLENCSCTAYSSANESSREVGCVTWYGDLMDTSTNPDVGQDLYVRVDAAVLAEYAKKSNALSKKGKLAISLASSAVLALLLLVSLLYWFMRRKRNAKQTQEKYIFRASMEDSTGDLNDENKMNSDVPFFDLRTIAASTDNFSIANKLGNGGFGSVYKGILCNGTEIAVKRLSKHSGQGVKEFKNEVVLIAKLQHRNLVRILGYCVQDEEKMLIYEYVPNRSLDFFIFDETKRALLDWTKRFGIICGIARGILYLHQDSRLRIIHRDLKASNILLDGSMNPKIADFGMARIFSGDQSEASTSRVVGTYGYMSPEYAMEGLFSVKSDVYSFGVLLLEIITGKRNAGYYHEKYPDSNLVGHVWALWKEGKALEIVDSCLDEAFPVNGVLRCIQIALLCVQEFATDRPTMPTVVFMLGNDAALASARRPAFLVKRIYSDGELSVNDVTCTMVEAR
ncbi:G-type lectin S-receptor-like serine/threonine-protein kinase At1g11410 [Rosa chinensis]|nr:G-type lectin S-receptor-like serine/threonine-protein kinase At1g11410 [Rosa chinensis]